MIRVIATFPLKPDSLPTVLKIAQPLIDTTRQESGCLDYTMVQADNDKNKLVILESWENQQYLDAHSASTHFAEYVPQLAALCTTAPIVESYQVII